MENFWSICLGRFEQELSSQQFNTWIKPLRFEVHNGAFRLLAPNRFVQQWVKDRFLHRIELLAVELLAQPVQIELTLSENGHKNGAAVPGPSVAQITSLAESSIVAIKSASKPAKKAKTSSELCGLNASFNFDNFVTGKANQLARAAALQVAENPGTAYNPLFIYGGVGLGKTHLLQAVAHLIRERKPQARIAYVHSERFVSEMVTALQRNRINEFKNTYRSLDALLIDDIQFFAGKERSQEEFFHTFNALIESQHQVILTCDRYPKEVDGLEERLKSRFGWGLTVAIEPPDLETCVAILIGKAQAIGVALPEEVAFFIAKCIRSNVRELEGALRRVIANARFTGRAIDLEFAREALKDLLTLKARLVTVENIQKTVADYYKLRMADLLS